MKIPTLLDNCANCGIEYIVNEGTHKGQYTSSNITCKKCRRYQQLIIRRMWVASAENNLRSKKSKRYRDRAERLSTSKLGGSQEQWYD